MEKFKIPAISFAIALSITIFSIAFTALFYQPKKDIKRGFQIEISADGKAVVKKEEKPVKKQVQEVKQVKKSDNSFTKEEIIKRLLGNK